MSMNLMVEHKALKEVKAKESDFRQMTSNGQ